MMKLSRTTFRAFGSGTQQGEHRAVRQFYSGRFKAGFGTAPLMNGVGKPLRKDIQSLADRSVRHCRDRRGSRHGLRRHLHQGQRALSLDIH